MDTKTPKPAVKTERAKARSPHFYVEDCFGRLSRQIPHDALVAMAEQQHAWHATVRMGLRTLRAK
jgi:hypothetical protein